MKNLTGRRKTLITTSKSKKVPTEEADARRSDY